LKRGTVQSPRQGDLRPSVDLARHPCTRQISFAAASSWKPSALAPGSRWTSMAGRARGGVYERGLRSEGHLVESASADPNSGGRRPRSGLRLLSAATAPGVGRLPAWWWPCSAISARCSWISRARAIQRLCIRRRPASSKTACRSALGDRVELDGIDWPPGGCIRPGCGHAEPAAKRSRPWPNCDGWLFVGGPASDLDPLQLSRFLTQRWRRRRRSSWCSRKPILLARRLCWDWDRAGRRLGLPGLECELSRGGLGYALRRQTRQARALAVLLRDRQGGGKSQGLCSCP